MSATEAMARDLQRTKARSLKNRMTTRALLKRYAQARSHQQPEVDHPLYVEPERVVEPPEVEPEPPVNDTLPRRVKKPLPAPAPPQPPLNQRHDANRQRRDQAQSELKQMHEQLHETQLNKAKLIRQEQKLLKWIDKLTIEAQVSDSDSDSEIDDDQDDRAVRTSVGARGSARNGWLQW